MPVKHTVIIPSYNTLGHLKNTYKSLKLYASKVPLIIIDDASTDGTSDWLSSLNDPLLKIIISPVRRGHTYWYDEGMKVAATEVVSILHSDMIIGPLYFENLLKHLKPQTVVCATRIEPPIHGGGKEKIVKAFGDDYDSFEWGNFESFVKKEADSQKGNITHGIFAPWILYKTDHFKTGGHDQRFAPYGYEDSDIFNQWILAGYTMVQARDSLCYHMTCRGHRWNKGVGIENPDYRATMEKGEREFWRKWGDWIHNDAYQHPIIYPKLDKGIMLINGNMELLKLLEPLANNIYINFSPIEYIKAEQPRTVESLSERIKQHMDPFINSILIYVNGNSFTPSDLSILKSLPSQLPPKAPQGELVTAESTVLKAGNLTLEIKTG